MELGGGMHDGSVGSCVEMVQGPEKRRCHGSEAKVFRVVPCRVLDPVQLQAYS